MILQKFGIEIRRLDSVQDLYRDVDRTLRAAEIRAGEVSVQMKVHTTAHALQKLFQQSYFSSYDVKKIAELSGLIISVERVRMYEAVGTLNYNEMTPEYRQILIAMVLDDFRSVLNPAEEAQLIKT